MTMPQDDIIAQLQRTVERQSAQLRQTVEQLSAQISDLQAQVATLRTRAESKPASRSRGVSTSRRRLLKRLGMLAAGLGVVGATEFTLSTQQAHADAGDGETLQTSETFYDGTFAASLPPLDSNITWSRGVNHSDTVPVAEQFVAQHLADNPRLTGGHPFNVELDTNPINTHELVSLIYEVSPEAPECYAYPLYVQLRTAHDIGDCTGINSTMFQTGDGWATTIHAEPHQDDGAGVTIGVNVEANRSSGTGRIIGANIQATTGTSDEGINIQAGPDSSWETGLNFEESSHGTRAIWIQGNWAVGLDLDDNHLRMNAGQKICLEKTEEVYLMYNPSSQRIEFWRSGTNVASF